MPPRRARFGQHFLVDDRVVERILDASKVAPEEVVLEVGPGKGVLTHRLAERAKRVVAIERDADLARELARHAAPNVEVIRGDAVRTPLPPFDRCVSNLPYEISSPFTFRLLDERFTGATLMFQLEFAKRMVAGPGSHDYGRLSVNVAWRAECRILFRVPPGCFRPSPRVMSAVVDIVPRARPPFEVADADVFRRVVEAAFSQRRKTLRNGLLNRLDLLGWKKADLQEALASVPGVEQRPEALTPAELAAVANALVERSGADRREAPE